MINIEAVFVGAGMSVGAGLPGWYRLIGGLAGASLPPQEYVVAQHLIDAAQTYINDHNLYELITYLKAELDTTRVAPTVSHEALTQLPVNAVFTANFDDLLEKAFRNAGKRVHVVVSDNDIPFMLSSEQGVNIIKMYGDLSRPDSIVLAKQQYEQFFMQRPQMIKLLETELARSTMLYIGWSHTDPHFSLLFGQLLSRYQDMMHTGYALTFDLPDAQKAELKRKRIRVVELSSSADLNQAVADWLTANCVQATTSSSSNTPSSTPPPVPPTSSTPVSIKSLTNSVNAHKIKRLNQQFADLTEECDAVYTQLSSALSSAERIKLQRQIDQKEAEMAKIEKQIEALQ